MLQLQHEFWNHDSCIRRHHPPKILAIFLWNLIICLGLIYNESQCSNWAKFDSDSFGIITLPWANIYLNLSALKWHLDLARFAGFRSLNFLSDQANTCHFQKFYISLAKIKINSENYALRPRSRSKSEERFNDLF